jgi:D-serine deaminase-like pyridoxal phosphate-dependent protein
MIITTVAGIGALALGAYALKPKANGRNYDPYFAQLNGGLRKYKRAVPSLIIDLDVLDENMAALKKIMPAHAAYRVVAKSLPSHELLAYIMQGMATRKVMVFHQPFLSDIARNADSAMDILIGKPMPVKTCEYFYATLKAENGLNAEKQIQWLIDSKQRLQEYLNLAIANNLKLGVNVEIDVGLHRGGLKDVESLSEVLKLIEENAEHLVFRGLMGYDPHVVKVPSVLLSREKAFAKANNFYKKCIALVKEKHAALWNENLTFNGAGSPTVALHSQYDTVLNDVAAGSCLVKPTDFDIDTLEGFKPASFIATPVLKKMKDTELPAIENMKGLMSIWNPNLRQSFFIYGGAWMANYVQPPGVNENKLFGKSTNQTMVNVSENVELDVNDFVFLRPHQSEFVFLQFSQILATRKGEILDEWSLFQQH